MKKVYFAIFLAFIILTGCSNTSISTTSDVGSNDSNAESLFLAVEFGNLKKVESLLDSGVDVNIVDGNLTALKWAISKKNPDMIELLLKRGANPSKIDNLNTSALKISVNTNNVDVVEALITNSQLNLDEPTDSEGSTALMGAVILGNKEIVKILLEEGANVNIRDSGGFTALTFADALAGPGIDEIKKMLVDYGAK